MMSTAHQRARSIIGRSWDSFFKCTILFILPELQDPLVITAYFYIKPQKHVFYSQCRSRNFITFLSSSNNEFKDKSVQLGYSYHVPDTRLPGRIVSMTKRPDIVRLLAFAVSP